MRAQHGSAMFVGILVVAEMVEFAFPTRTEVWFLHSDGYRDGGTCVFSADPPDGCRDVGFRVYNTYP